MPLRKIIFVIPPEVHLLDITGPIHVFYEAIEYGAALDLQFVTLSQNIEVKSSAKLFLSNLTPFQDFELSEDDFIFIPGLEAELLLDDNFISSIRPFLSWLTKQQQNGASICSVCTGAFILAATGLLNGKACTTHWKFMERFIKKFPKINTLKNRLFTDEDKLYTSAGVSSGIDLSLYILEKLYGAKFAVDIAKEVVIYFRRGESDTQLSIFLAYRNHINNQIHEAQDYIQSNLSQSLLAEDIAEKVNMSLRNFTRVFKKNTGITVGQYIEKLRLEMAVELLSQNHKIEFVANQCGLKSPNQLRSLLKKYKGLLPSELKEA